MEPYFEERISGNLSILVESPTIKDSDALCKRPCSLFQLFMNNGGGDAVAPGRGFVVAVQNQNIVPRLGVFLYMGGFADGCKEGEYTGTYQ